MSENWTLYALWRGSVTIRCILDGLMLPAVVRPAQVPPLVAFEGHESFPVEAVEALYYELVAATREEVGFSPGGVLARRMPGTET